MGVFTSLQTNKYYDYFRDKEIVFTKNNLKTLKIDPRQIYIKCNGGQWPCIINSTSLQMVKIIVGTQSGAYTYLSKNKTASASVRYCFVDSKGEPIHFFVNCVVSSIAVYQNSQELALVTLNFTQRPPDDLINHLGEFIETTENFVKRKFEVVEINKNTLHVINMDKEETFIFISKIPRKCILKSISFSGVKVMLVGIPKFLLEKDIDLKISFTDTLETYLIPGVIKEAESLEAKKEIAICQILFKEDEIPMGYKMHINTFLTSYKAKLQAAQKNIQTQEAQRQAAINAKNAQLKQQAAAANAATASTNKPAGVQPNATGTAGAAASGKAAPVSPNTTTVAKN